MLDSYAFVLYNIGIPIKYFPKNSFSPPEAGRTMKHKANN